MKGPADQKDRQEGRSRSPTCGPATHWGFKTHHHPKLEIHRESEGKPLLHLDDPEIVAVAGDTPLPNLKIPCLDLNDPGAVADFILSYTGLK